MVPSPLGAVVVKFGSARVQMVPTREWDFVHASSVCVYQHTRVDEKSTVGVGVGVTAYARFFAAVGWRQTPILNDCVCFVCILCGIQELYTVDQPAASNTASSAVSSNVSIAVVFVI